MSTQKTFTNIAFYTIGEIIPRILSFLLLPILTKYLTTSDYGISGYINTVITFLYAFTTLSINTYALRNFYKYESIIERRKLLGNIFLFLIGWGLIMFFLEIILVPYLLGSFSIQVPFYPFFFIALIINFFEIMSVVPLIVYRVKEDAKGFATINIARTILQLVFILLLVAYFKMGLLGSFLGRLIATLPFVVMYFVIIKKNGIFYFNIPQIKEGLRFSLPLLPGALSYLVISLLDRVVLERYVSLSELGLYSVASTLALTLNIVIQGLYRSFEQKIFKEHNKEGYEKLIDNLYKIYIAALFIPGFFLILFAKEVLLFFTSSQYYPAQAFVVYLVIAVVVSGLSTFLRTLLIADNRRKIVTYSSFASAVISVIANIVLIKYFGVLGACIASILSFLVVYIFYSNTVRLLSKYYVQQLSFAAIFFLVTYLMPTVSLSLSITIKVVLALLFVIVVKTTMNIRLPSMLTFKYLNIFNSNKIQNR